MWEKLLIIYSNVNEARLKYHNKSYIQIHIHTRLWYPTTTTMREMKRKRWKEKSRSMLLIKFIWFSESGRFYGWPEYVSIMWTIFMVDRTTSLEKHSNNNNNNSNNGRREPNIPMFCCVETIRLFRFIAKYGFIAPDESSKEEKVRCWP